MVHEQTEKGDRSVVTVHRFRVWDQMRGELVPQPLKSTEERIRMIKGEIIPGTAEDVAETALDKEGRYDPQGIARRP
jgi:hypothetical protein